MPKREGGWTLRLAILTLTLGVAGCVSGTNEAAMCEGSRAARAGHAEALAASADDRAVVTGAQLIALLDAACRGK